MARGAGASEAPSSTARRCQRGSSGSPLVDADGSVVGLSTHRIGDGFYLALPADEDLRARIDGLAEGGDHRRVVLGVGLAPAGVARRLRRSVGLPERDGLLVRGVDDGSPAAAAGLAEGDLLVAAGGRELREVDDLYDALDSVAARRLARAHRPPRHRGAHA